MSDKQVKTTSKKSVTKKATVPSVQMLANLVALLPLLKMGEHRSKLKSYIIDNTIKVVDNL